MFHILFIHECFYLVFVLDLYIKCVVLPCFFSKCEEDKEINNN